MRVRACAVSTLGTLASSASEGNSPAHRESPPAKANGISRRSGAEARSQLFKSDQQLDDLHPSPVLKRVSGAPCPWPSLMNTSTERFLDNVSNAHVRSFEPLAHCAKSISAPTPGAAPSAPKATAPGLRPAGYSSDPSPAPASCDAGPAGLVVPAATSTPAGQPYCCCCVVPPAAEPLWDAPASSGQGRSMAPGNGNQRRAGEGTGSQRSGAHSPLLAHGDPINAASAATVRSSCGYDTSGRHSFSCDANAAACGDGFSCSAPAHEITFVPSLLELLDDFDQLSSLGHRGAHGGSWLGVRHGQRFVVKLAGCAEWDPDGISASAAAPAGALRHPNLLTPCVVRAAPVDEGSLQEMSAAGLAARQARAPRQACVVRRRPADCLHSVLTTPSLLASDSGPSGASFSIVTDDLCRNQAAGQAARRALALLRLPAGAVVVATVTPYCELGNLHAMSYGAAWPFRASPSWPLHVAQRALLRTAREIASGLAALHAAGLAHGGLHPANVLLAASAADRRGFEARLADVGGTSLAAAAAEGANMQPASPWVAVLPPEAWRDPAAVGRPAADVYAYGVLLYLMAAGEMPYEGQHLALTAAALAEGPQPEWPAGQHDHLAPLYRACTARRAEDRPTSTQIVADIVALEQRVKEAKRARDSRPGLRRAAAARGSATPA